MDKGDLQSLLRQAAMVPGANVPAPAHLVAAPEILEKATEITDENLHTDKWDKIKEAMEGRFAERFINEMDGLSGREFIRVYGKMIEYFKPKIVRIEGDKEQREENVIRIEIHHSNPVIEETIDIETEEE